MLVELGTRLEVTVADRDGRLSIDSEGADYSGRLIDSVDVIERGQHIRIQIGLDSGADQSVSFNPAMTLMGTVSAIDEDEIDEASFPVQAGVRFAVEVLRLARGLLWSAVATEPEQKTPEGSIGHSKSGVEVRVEGDEGKLEISGASVSFVGWLVRVPLEFFIGQQLHLRVVVPTKKGRSESIDVLGRVVQILSGETRTGHAGFRDGVRFGFGIVQHSEGEFPLPVVGKRWVEEFLIDSTRVPAELFIPASSGPSHSSAELTGMTDPGKDGSRSGQQGESEPTGIIGSLRQLSLLSLLQSLELNRRTACIQVSGTEGHEQGTVFVRKGQVVAAFSESIVGEEAFYALAMLDRGGFRVSFGEPAPLHNIKTSTTELILEVLNRTDEDSGVTPEDLSDVGSTDPSALDPVVQDTVVEALDVDAAIAAAEAAKQAKTQTPLDQGDEDDPPAKRDEPTAQLQHTDRLELGEQADTDSGEPETGPTRPKDGLVRAELSTDPAGLVSTSPDATLDDFSPLDAPEASAEAQEKRPTEPDTLVGAINLPRLPLKEEAGAVFEPQSTVPDERIDSPLQPPAGLADLTGPESTEELSAPGAPSSVPGLVKIEARERELEGGGFDASDETLEQTEDMTVFEEDEAPDDGAGTGDTVVGPVPQTSSSKDEKEVSQPSGNVFRHFFNEHENSKPHPKK